MFGVADRLLVRGPAHVVDPRRVVRLFWTMRSGSGGERTIATLDRTLFANLVAESHAFSAIGQFNGPNPMLFGPEENLRFVQRDDATPGFFTVLGARPALGRFFTQEEGDPQNTDRVVVLGYALWQSDFGGDRSIVGRSIPIGSGDIHCHRCGAARIHGRESRSRGHLVPVARSRRLASAHLEQRTRVWSGNRCAAQAGRESRSCRYRCDDRAPAHLQWEREGLGRGTRLRRTAVLRSRRHRIRRGTHRQVARRPVRDRVARCMCEYRESACWPVPRGAVGSWQFDSRWVRAVRGSFACC